MYILKQLGLDLLTINFFKTLHGLLKIARFPCFSTAFLLLMTTILQSNCC